ncbi:MAG: GNAT family N-acetyltransferase [Chloroflexi bacterium]|nr:GNAT family N-acetyltransferase [Chloroflexota bacterium]
MSQPETPQESDIQIIDLTPENAADYGFCGYKDVKKHLELRRKIEWFDKYYSKGLRTKIVVSKTGGYQGMIEYIPGEYAHRPVAAQGYMFIHCIFVGFKNEYKGKGYAKRLLEACIRDAENQTMKGVAVVTRKGPFMAKKDIFEKRGFHLVDRAKPDFELLVLKFDASAEDPKFLDITVKGYQDGVTILRSPQCPYSVKNVDAMLETAKKMNMPVQLVELDDAESAQKAPCAFGTFCIINNGKVLTHHPISNARFVNLIK